MGEVSRVLGMARLPQLHGTVVASRGQQVAPGEKGDGRNRPEMHSNGARGAAGKFPQLDCPVVTAEDQGVAVRCESHRPDEVIGRLKRGLLIGGGESPGTLEPCLRRYETKERLA